jgi:hypothetical protein
MKTSRWVDCNLEDCPNCGGQLRMFTNMTDEEIAKSYYQDGDSVQCEDGCSAEGLYMSVSDGEAFVNGLW